VIGRPAGAASRGRTTLGYGHEPAFLVFRLQALRSAATIHFSPLTSHGSGTLDGPIPPLSMLAVFVPPKMKTASIAANPPVRTRAGVYRWTICALLFLATTINYIDRQTISVLAPDLQHALH
jgi:hypothetical protein